MHTRRHLLPLLLLTSLNAWSDPEGMTVAYDVDGETYEGYFITNDKDAPLVYLLHDWDGLTDYEFKRAGMLADMGYSVFCADLFGKGVRPTKLEDKRKCTGELYEDRDKMRALLEGGLKAARGAEARVDHAVAMGYCFGGTAVLELARSGADLKGFVTFHGGLTTPEGQDYTKVKAPCLILHGSSDTHVTLDHLKSLGEAFEKAGVEHELISYGGAPHAWTVFQSDRYREKADQKSWARFSDFLKERLQK